jgi:hypothetical protein
MQGHPSRSGDANVMNPIDRLIELAIFSSRWLVVPFLLGRIAGLAALLATFMDRQAPSAHTAIGVRIVKQLPAGRAEAPRFRRQRWCHRPASCGRRLFTPSTNPQGGCRCGLTGRSCRGLARMTLDILRQSDACRQVVRYRKEVPSGQSRSLAAVYDP